MRFIPLLLALLAAPAAAADLLVIGNSITRHDPLPAIGWTHAHGMAASRPERDWAHLAGRRLGLRLRTVNVAPTERDAPVPAIEVPSATALVVVQLGDNVLPRHLAGWPAKYRALLAQLRSRPLLCVSTFWQDFRKDAAMYDACTAAGGDYVYIGDVRRDRANPDAAAHRFADDAVDQHPKDWGMRRIAERVVRAARHRQLTRKDTGSSEPKPEGLPVSKMTLPLVPT